MVEQTESLWLLGAILFMVTCAWFCCSRLFGQSQRVQTDTRTNIHNQSSDQLSHCNNMYDKMTQFLMEDIHNNGPLKIIIDDLQYWVDGITVTDGAVYIINSTKFIQSTKNTISYNPDCLLAQCSQFPSSLSSIIFILKAKSAFLCDDIQVESEIYDYIYHIFVNNFTQRQFPTLYAIIALRCVNFNQHLKYHTRKTLINNSVDCLQVAMRKCNQHSSDNKFMYDNNYNTQYLIHHFLFNKKDLNKSYINIIIKEYTILTLHYSINYIPNQYLDDSFNFYAPAYNRFFNLCVDLLLHQRYYNLRQSLSLYDRDGGLSPMVSSAMPQFITTLTRTLSATKFHAKHDKEYNYSLLISIVRKVCYMIVSNKTIFEGSNFTFLVFKILAELYIKHKFTNSRSSIKTILRCIQYALEKLNSHLETKITNKLMYDEIFDPMEYIRTQSSKLELLYFKSSVYFVIGNWKLFKESIKERKIATNKCKDTLLQVNVSMPNCFNNVCYTSQPLDNFDNNSKLRKIKLKYNTFKKRLIFVRYNSRTRTGGILKNVLDNNQNINMIFNIASVKQCNWMGCMKKDCKLRRCRKCKSVYYCSKLCQKKDWILSVNHSKPHKYVCQIRQRRDYRITFE